MPVTLTIASHEANAVQRRGGSSSAKEFLRNACQMQGEQAREACGELLQSSLSRDELAQSLNVRHGFVDTVIRAYNQHHHLIIRYDHLVTGFSFALPTIITHHRPDDIWTAILSQFQY